MIVKAIIKRHPAGQVVNEVLDRQQHLCQTVYNITNALGKQLSDEEIGPDCDSVVETTTEGTGT
jgi:hypothetical protein